MTAERRTLCREVWLLLAVTSRIVQSEAPPDAKMMRSVEITAGARPNLQPSTDGSLMASSSNVTGKADIVPGAHFPHVPNTGCIEKVASGFGRKDAADCTAPVEHWCSALKLQTNCSTSSLCRWTKNSRCEAHVAEPYTSGAMVDLWITAAPFCASIKENSCEMASELCQSGLVEAHGGLNYCVPKTLRSQSMLTEDEAWTFCSNLKEDQCTQSRRCAWGEHPTADGWKGCSPVSKQQYELMEEEIKKYKAANADLQARLVSAKGDYQKSGDCSGASRLPKGTGDGLHFRCKSGFCISYADRCNGFKNCGDGSDEEGCDAGTWESAWNRWPLKANLVPQ